MGNLWHVGSFIPLAFVSDLAIRKTEKRRKELQLIIGLLLMVGYCLAKAHSATSAICVLLGGLTMVVLGLRSMNKRAIGTYVVATTLLFGFAQLTFDIYGNIVELSGHEITIEGRGVLWGLLLTFGTNPISGLGFESFWLGDKLDRFTKGFRGAESRPTMGTLIFI